jgi:hypothetical protein
LLVRRSPAGVGKEGGRAKRIENSELKVTVYLNIPFFYILSSALVRGQSTLRIG